MKSKLSSVLTASAWPSCSAISDAAVLADGVLFGQQRVDGLERADLAALELAHGVFERLQRARHPQADEAGGGCGRGGGAIARRAHRRLSEPAPGDGVVEAEGTGDHAPSAIRICPMADGIGGRRRLAVPGSDAALVAALQHRMRGDQRAVLEDAHLARIVCTSTTRLRAVSGTL